MRARTAIREGVAVLVLAVAAATAAGAQATPAEVVREFFSAVAAQRWAEAASYLDIRLLEDQRRSEIWSYRQLGPPRPPTLEGILRSDPDMPRVAAEYQLRQALRRWELHRSQHFESFARVDSVEQLERLPPNELAARWVEANDPIGRLKGRFLDAGCPFPPDLEASLRHRRIDLLGIVVADSARAFAVVAEMAGLRVEADKPRLIHLTRRAGEWRLRPDYELLLADLGVGLVGCRRQ